MNMGRKIKDLESEFYLIMKNLPEDTLSKIHKVIDWKVFEDLLSKLPPSLAESFPLNPLKMLKILLIQRIYDHSDEDLMYYLHAILTYWRFIGFLPKDLFPDIDSIIRFREELKKLGIYEACYIELIKQLKEAKKSHYLIEAKIESAKRKIREEYVKLIKVSS